MNVLPTRFRVRSPLRRAKLRIDADAARAFVEKEGAILVDVRRTDDPTKQLPGSVRIPPDEIPGRLGEFPPDTPIVLACT